MAYEELTTKFWEPAVEDESVEGILISVVKDVGEHKSKIYNFENTKTNFSVWGSAILDQRMALAKPGDKLRITYKGLTEQKNEDKNPAKIFKVEIDRD